MKAPTADLSSHGGSGPRDGGGMGRDLALQPSQGGQEGGIQEGGRFTLKSRLRRENRENQ